ncbi:MAG TPA: glycosyltransferase family 4 protein [Acidobacteriota bacterium]|nr:glycosyltransferase family 4 protein [Acidobacteriota bacterium]HNT17629.1 glycosyltransferase family 4 protein [Acidobacteriota bacterium]
MNILLIDHYAGSPNMGMELRPYYLAKEWGKMGHKVVIVAGSFSHIRGRQPSIRSFSELEESEGVDYFWIKTPSYKGSGISRIISILVFVAKLLMKSGKLASKIRPDIVIASSTYPFDIFPAKRIAAKAGARLVFEVHDLWPLSPVELGGMSTRHPFIVVTQWVENYAYRSADKVVSLLPLAKKHMVDHGMEGSKFIHVPNGIFIDEPTKEIPPIPGTHRIIMEAGKKRKMLQIGYFGSFVISNDLETLFKTANLLRNDPVQFMLVGEGPEKENLMELKEKLRLDNLSILPFVSKASAQAMMREMDALYIGWKKKGIYRFGISPNKLIEYMFAGKPVLYAIEAGNNMVEEAGCGICARPENPESMKDAILRMAGMSPDERDEMGSRGRRHVLENYMFGDLAGKFLDGVNEKKK